MKNTINKLDIIKNIVNFIMILLLLSWVCNAVFKFMKPTYIFVFIPILVLIITHYLYKKILFYHIFVSGKLYEYYKSINKKTNYNKTKYKNILFIMACFMGDEELINDIGPVKGLEAGLGYLEYLLISQKYQEAEQILRDIKNNYKVNNPNGFNVVNIAEDVIAGKYDDIIRNSDTSMTNSIIKYCRNNYWKGYALYMSDRKTEACVCFRNVINANTKTIYEIDSKKYIDFNDNSKNKVIIPRFIESLELKDYIVMGLLCLISLLLVLNVLIPVQNTNTNNLYDKYFYTSANKYVIAIEEESSSYKQVIYINYKLKEFDYCLYKKQNNKYLMEKSYREPIMVSLDDSIIEINSFKMGYYYQHEAFCDLNKYIIFDKKIKKEHSFVGIDFNEYTYLEEDKCGRDNEFICYRIITE